jgi:uncharacterized protein DUF4339
MNIFIFKDGRREGPYSLEEVRRLRADGKVMNSDYAWQEGLADWVPLASIPGIASPITPLVPPGAPPVPPMASIPIPAPSGGESDGLLLVKRLATAFVLFCVLFVFIFIVIFFISLMVGGGIAGAEAAAAHPDSAQGFQNGYALGEQAGRDFGEKYTIPIAEVSAAVAFVLGVVSSLWISFSNLLPWCRHR